MNKTVGTVIELERLTADAVRKAMNNINDIAPKPEKGKKRKHFTLGVFIQEFIYASVRNGSFNTFAAEIKKDLQPEEAELAELYNSAE
jgi:hypothetical protein